MDKNWLRAKAEEEIEGAKRYFDTAQTVDEYMMPHFIEMGKDELKHAGCLYGMMAEMK